MWKDEDPQNRRLSELFVSYRDACPDPEPDVNFMPLLWRRIEAQQSYTRDLKWLAQGLVTAAAAMSLLMGIFLTRVEPPVSFYTSTYVEVLAAEQDSAVEIVPVAQERN